MITIIFTEYLVNTKGSFISNGWCSISSIDSSKAVSKTPAFKFFQNPLVQLGATLFISWALRPKVPDTT
jgi:hypothetical protein